MKECMNCGSKKQELYLLCDKLDRLKLVCNDCLNEVRDRIEIERRITSREVSPEINYSNKERNY